jgi:hypothetical protein
MRFNNRIRIIMEQPRRPQRRVEVLTLGLELGRQAPIKHDRTGAQRLSECGDHQPNLASGDVLLVAELKPVVGQGKIETGGTVSANSDQPLPDGQQLLAQPFGPTAC